MIRPIRNNILVEPILEDEMSAGGIIVPESFRGRTSKAKVVAVGNGTKDDKPWVPIGATVWHIKDAGTEIIHGGKRYFILNGKRENGDVLGYLEV